MFEEDQGVIEIDMFSENVDGNNHPEAQGFRELLNSVADEYNCCLTFFEVHKGTVQFSFDNDELMADILKIFEQHDIKSKT